MVIGDTVIMLRTYPPVYSVTYGSEGFSVWSPDSGFRFSRLGVVVVCAAVAPHIIPGTFW